MNNHHPIEQRIGQPPVAGHDDLDQLSILEHTSSVLRHPSDDRSGSTPAATQSGVSSSSGGGAASCRDGSPTSGPQPMVGMRALTVRQPAAWAIIHAGKDVENRTRSLGPYRGPVAIVAGREVLHEEHPFWDHPLYRAALARETAWARDRLDVRGAIIGVVDLVDVHRNSDTQGCLPSGNHDGRLKPCSGWAEHGAHHLVLTNPRALDQPIAWRGALGLRSLDAETIARIQGAIA